MTTLRPMIVADVPAVLRVQHAGAVAGLSEVFDQARYPFSDAQVGARWRTELADVGVCAWVLEDDAGVAGFAAVRGDELLHLGTRLDTWGTGLAAALHDAVLAEAARAGTPVTRLRVFRANVRARRLYVRLGWSDDGTRTRSDVPPHPVLIGMRRAPETVTATVVRPVHPHAGDNQDGRETNPRVAQPKAPRSPRVRGLARAVEGDHGCALAPGWSRL